MELYQLRYFVQVARLESVSGAAQVLHVSQPAISKAIAKLEEELGAQLFDREGGHLLLNNRGRHYFASVERVLRELGEAAETLRGDKPSVQGSVSVGVFGTQSEAVECITAFMAAYPQVFVTFDARQQSMTSRVTREFDMVFYGDGPGFESIRGMTYATTRLMLCVPDSHPLASCTSVDLARLRNDPFIFMNTTAGVYEQGVQLCHSAGFSPTVRAVTSSGAAQMRFIQEGLGVGLVDTMRVNAFKRRGVSLLQISSPAQAQAQCFACRPVGMLSRAARELLEFALGFFKLPFDEACACFAAN